MLRLKREIECCKVRSPLQRVKEFNLFGIGMAAAEVVMFSPRDEDAHVSENAHQLRAENFLDFWLEESLTQLSEAWIGIENGCQCNISLARGQRSHL